jgi:ABC-type transport system involved in cytochrome bd biosynthesis fused ATPase/permease subunit
MVDILDNIFPLALAIFIINIYFFSLTPVIGIISMIGFVIIIFIIVRVAPHFIKTSAHKESKFNDMTEKLHDSFSNLMNVYLNNQDFQEITKNKNIENNQSKLLKQELLNIKNVVLYLSITSAIIFGVIIYTSYYLFTKKQISSQVFINILIILIGYFSYLIRISKLTPELLAKIGIVKNSESFLNSILSRQEKQLTSDDYINGSILFQNVDFKYPESKKKVFDNFNLEIKQNEKVVIMGTSGSGKTTLIKLLLRMYSVNKGNILINNKDIKLIDVNILRQKINYINQRTNLFDNTILNNIKYGNQVDDSTIINILDQYNLKDIYKGVEKGVYDEAGVNGTNLSLGMQKLTMIMRGLLKGGDIVIYDEPLAGLDKSTRSNIIKLIIENSINKTLIIISHNKDFIKHVNRVIDLNKFNKKH